MKILNIQLSLFEEVPTTIRGGATVQYGTRQTDTAKYKVVFQNGNYRCVCGLTDNPVDDNQAACIDYIPED